MSHDRNKELRWPRTGYRHIVEWIWFAVSLISMWAVLGVSFIGFWGFGAIHSWTRLVLLIFVSPLIYFLGLWLLTHLWIDNSEEDESEIRATLKRFGRFALAVGGTVAFFAFLYFVFPWLGGSQ